MARRGGSARRRSCDRPGCGDPGDAIRRDVAAGLRHPPPADHATSTRRVSGAMLSGRTAAASPTANISSNGSSRSTPVSAATIAWPAPSPPATPRARPASGDVALMRIASRGNSGGCSRPSCNTARFSTVHRPVRRGHAPARYRRHGPRGCRPHPSPPQHRLRPLAQRPGKSTATGCRGLRAHLVDTFGGDAPGARTAGVHVRHRHGLFGTDGLSGFGHDVDTRLQIRRPMTSRREPPTASETPRHIPGVM